MSFEEVACRGIELQILVTGIQRGVSPGQDRYCIQSSLVVLPGLILEPISLTEEDRL